MLHLACNALISLQESFYSVTTAVGWGGVRGFRCGCTGVGTSCDRIIQRCICCDASSIITHPSPFQPPGDCRGNNNLLWFYCEQACLPTAPLHPQPVHMSERHTLLRHFQTKVNCWEGRLSIGSSWGGMEICLIRTKFQWFCHSNWAWFCFPWEGSSEFSTCAFPTSPLPFPQSHDLNQLNLVQLLPRHCSLWGLASFSCYVGAAVTQWFQ